MSYKANEDKEEKKVSVKSKVVGVVYTDIVCYILPGLLFLFGLILILGMARAFSDWCASIGTTMGVVLAFIIPATCYGIGIIISICRWFIDILVENRNKTISLGNLVNGDVCNVILEKVGLPEPVRAEARKRIAVDLKRLGWDKVTDKDKKKSKKSEKMDSMPQKELVDCFWLLMIGSLRESDSILFLYYDRWDDIYIARKNIVFTMELLAFVWLIYSVIQSWQWSVTSLCTIITSYNIIIPLVALLLLVTFYFLVLPLTRFFDMRWLLLSYLAGRFKVFEDES